MLLVREAVRKYNVIIATCVGSGHEMFDDVTFERVIIDECAQSIGTSVTDARPPKTQTIRSAFRCIYLLLHLFVCEVFPEPSNLIPLGHGCRSVVLIGDHKQLPPTIVSREASDGGYEAVYCSRRIAWL